MSTRTDRRALGDVRERLWRVRDRVQRWLDPDRGGRAGKIVDLAIMSLILASVLAATLETMPQFQPHLDWFWRFEVLIAVIFTMEYVLRIWSIPAHPDYADPVLGRLRHMADPFLVVDLLAIAPFYVNLALGTAVETRHVRAVRLLRFFRIAKMARYSEGLRTVVRVVKRKRDELALAVGVNLVLILITASFVYFVERPVQPGAFKSIPHTLYWAFVTLTTVGYGDIVPVTGWGRTLAVVMAFFGVGLVALPASILSGGFAEEGLRDRSPDEVDCPDCGRTIDVDGNSGGARPMDTNR